MIDLPALQALKAILRKAAPRDAAFLPPSPGGKDALLQAQRLVENDGGMAVGQCMLHTIHTPPGHPVLWRTLARAALMALDMDVAEHALMRCGDLQVWQRHVMPAPAHMYTLQGLQVVRALRQHGLARQIIDVAALLGEWRSAAQRSE